MANPKCDYCGSTLKKEELDFHAYECPNLAFVPQPGPQTFVLRRTEKEIYFGGSAGGSKTFAQIGWFLRWAGAWNEDGSPMYPNFRGAVIRLKYQDLKDWIDKADGIYGKLGARTVGTPAEFRFETGAIIRTGHLGDSKAWRKYQGWAIHKLVIDEVNQLPLEETYLLLRSRVRESPDGNPQTFSAGNPGGAGDYWVRKRFIKLIDPDGSLHLPNTGWTDPVTGDTRIFVPSKLSDNKVLERIDPGYRANLMGLPEKKRRALLDGDYDALEGAAFDDFRQTHSEGEPENACHVVPLGSVTLQPYWHRWGSIDWGFEHPSACYKFCLTPEGRIYVYDELIMQKVGAFEQGIEIATWWRKELYDLPDHQLTIFLSHDAFARRDEPKTQAERLALGIEMVLGQGGSFLARMSVEEEQLAASDPTAAEASYLQRLSQMQDRPGIVIHRANNNRVAGANYIRELLNWSPPIELGEPDMNVAHSLLRAKGELEMRRYLAGFDRAKYETGVRPILQIIGPREPLAKEGCPVLIESLPTRVIDEKNPESVQKIPGQVTDDAYDSFYYGALGHRDIVVAAPRQYVLNEIMDRARQQYTDPTILNQIAMFQAAKYDHEHRPVHGMTLPRAGSQRHRRFQ